MYKNFVPHFRKTIVENINFEVIEIFNKHHPCKVFALRFASPLLKCDCGNKKIIKTGFRSEDEIGANNWTKKCRESFFHWWSKRKRCRSRSILAPNTRRFSIEKQTRFKIFG